MPENEYDPQKELTEEELPNIDFVYGNDDYDPNAPEGTKDVNIFPEYDGEIKRVRVEDMRAPTGKKGASESLKMQMMADDMAMSLGDRPSLKDMSEKYASNKNELDILIEKGVLNRNEKETLKNRLQEEMGSRPEGFNQRRSLEMYHNLMDEQNAKEAQKGFFLLLILAALGIAAAALEYLLDLNPDGETARIYMDYIPFTTIAFSIVMLMKSKFFKILSIIYFILNTAVLIVPGLMVYAMDPANQEGGESGEFIIHITMFVLAVIFSVVVFIRLMKDKTIASYYAYSKRK